MLERTVEVVDQMHRGLDATAEVARAPIHDEAGHATVQQGRCHVERENEELKARLASLLGDHEKLATAEASLKSEHEDCCALLDARQVDHNALNKENIRLGEQLEKASHELEETMADSERSKEATRSFLGPHYSAMSALVDKWYKITRLADNLQTAIDYVDQDKTIAWYKTTDLEKAFKEMQKHTDFLRDETEGLRAGLRTVVSSYWPYYCGIPQAKQIPDTSDVELDFEQQQQKLEKLEKLFVCHIQKMEQRHETFVENIRQDLDAELKRYNHECTLCLASVRYVTVRQLEKFKIEETTHIYNTRNRSSFAAKRDADQTAKLQESHRTEIANLKATYEAQATLIREKGERTMSSLKAEHRASTERLEHEHEAVLKIANAHYHELYCSRNNVLDRLNEGHSRELKKLKADSEAKLTDAFEHTRHDREYIAQIDVLNEKIMKQQETILTDAQGIREDAEMIDGLRAQLVEFEDKMTEQGSELNRQKDSAHEQQVSWLNQHSELITTQWAVTQLEKDLKKVEADLEKAHATTTEKDTIINEQRSQHHRIIHYLTTTNSNLRRKHAALLASSSANELVLSASHSQEKEDLKKEHEAGVALLQKAIDKMERLRVEVSDVEGELAGARDEVGFWKQLFEDMEEEVGKLKEEKKKEEGDWGVEALD